MRLISKVLALTVLSTCSVSIIAAAKMNVDKSNFAPYSAYEVQNYTGWYAGISGGFVNTRGFTRELVNGQGFNVNNNALVPLQSKSTNGAAGRVFGGFNFSRMVALEAGFAGFHTANWRSTNGFKISNQEYAADLQGKLIFPLPNYFSVFGTFGAGYVWSRLQGNTLNADFIAATVRHRRIHALTFAFGAGVSYRVYQTDIQLYWQRWQARQNIQSIDMAAVGIAYHFA